MWEAVRFAVRTFVEAGTAAQATAKHENHLLSAAVFFLSRAGESAAGSRLAHMLAITGAQNVLVVVSRW